MCRRTLRRFRFRIQQPQVRLPPELHWYQEHLHLGIRKPSGSHLTNTGHTRQHRKFHMALQGRHIILRPIRRRRRRILTPATTLERQRTLPGQRITSTRPTDRQATMREAVLVVAFPLQLSIEVALCNGKDHTKGRQRGLRMRRGRDPALLLKRSKNSNHYHKRDR